MWTSTFFAKWLLNNYYIYHDNQITMYISVIIKICSNESILCNEVDTSVFK